VREQRCHVRVDVLGQIDAHSVWKLQPMTLRELSPSGFSLETTAPFEVHTINKFRLTLEGHARSVVVQAVTRHCRLESVSTALAIYIVGFEFTAMTDQGRQQLVSLVDFAESLWQDDAAGR
jgi:hypothetical protein